MNKKDTVDMILEGLSENVDVRISSWDGYTIYIYVMEGIEEYRIEKFNLNLETKCMDMEKTQYFRGNDDLKNYLASNINFENIEIRSIYDE